MSITKGFVYLLSLGIPFLILGIFTRNSLTIFILYNLICAALLIIDYFISPPESSLVITPSGDNNLSIYEKEEVCFEVYNRSSNRLYVEIKDEIEVLYFKVPERLMKGRLLPKEKRIFKYLLIPQKRGAFQFNNLHVRYEGRFGLCMKMYVLNFPREYKVYPNLKNLRKYRLSICNNRSFKQGQRNLRTLGRGTSFESLREYVPGDEYRKINWKATARGNKPIVNQYEPEKNQHVHIIIDTGRPMSYTLKGYRKLDMVVNTALVLSDIVNQNGDQSGLLIFNTEVKNMIMPGKGPGHRTKMLEALYHIDYTNQTSNFEEAFYHFKRKERHRSIIFLFTDFDTVEEAENLLKVLPVISRNHVVVIILIKNENLEELGEIPVKNSEDMFNKGVALELLSDRKRIINLLNKKGIFCLECPAEKVEYTAVNKYIQVKNRMYL